MKVESVAHSFAALFGRLPRVRAHAPGRVNLIGEHTDYNAGLVLPMPIPQLTEVELAPRTDRSVSLASTELGGDVRHYELGREHSTGSWIDYVQGVTRELLARGHSIAGFDARVHSEVPVGAGLSSSAALEVSMLRALREAFALSLDDLDIARIGQIAEVSFVGAPVGIMDQMVSSLGRQGSALFIDTESLRTRHVAIPASLEVIVIASGVTHAHGTGEYKTRRSECARAAELLGVPTLRALTRGDLERASKLEPTLARRVRHVVSENERVLSLLEAFAQNELSQIGPILNAAHASLRDDFEVSVPEIDRLVELASTQPGVLGARLTGGGFGGSVVMLAERGKALSAAHTIAARYAEATSQRPTVLLPRAPAE